ncbi:hypothetical protein [Spirulina sp. 06S082]|uniref:hypothetical protein n=1 Tax=Spirulina sp. 06S082 TaxID=3110248 RepID=UPI002B1E9E64|nr:hypothetical protein [Spirulina sp. 06S082]MEA5467558.1 hypothetical protein [Spirulina sp. 06S082]
MEITILPKGITMNKYSDFFKTLHDEVQPTGYLGRGSHYSVLRAVVWHDCLQRPLNTAAYLDFAVIWDEDHDTRVIEVIELLYFARLLTPAIIVGERKGAFSLIVSEETFQEFGGDRLAVYQKAIDEITQSLDDPWFAEVTSINSQNRGIINDDNAKIALYLQTITMLWKLGINSI